MDNETVILVGEDLDVKELATEPLQKEGYNVLDTNSLDNAMGYLGHDPTPYALIIEPIIRDCVTITRNPEKLRSLMSEANKIKVPRVIYAEHVFPLSVLSINDFDVFTRRSPNIEDLVKALSEMSTRRLHVSLLNPNQESIKVLNFDAERGGLTRVGPGYNVPLQEAFSFTRVPNERVLKANFPKVLGFVYQGPAAEVNEYCAFLEKNRRHADVLSTAIEYHF